MKTPEELYYEWRQAFDESLDEGMCKGKTIGTQLLHRAIDKEVFLAGYQAAKDQFADTSKVMKLNKDYDAKKSKLIQPTDEIGKEELKCMIAHFENEDYKISVMAPGILPKADGGELVCGCGFIVYDICKKVL